MPQWSLGKIHGYDGGCEVERGKGSPKLKVMHLIARREGKPSKRLLPCLLRPNQSPQELAVFGGLMIMTRDNTGYTLPALPYVFFAPCLAAFKDQLLWGFA